MSRARHQQPRSLQERRGYLVVLFVVILAFVGVAASMQLLILTSVATTSAAFDSYRQGSTELVRLQRAVTETLYDRLSPGALENQPLQDALTRRLSELAAGGCTVSAVLAPDSLPQMVSFPDVEHAPDPLTPFAAGAYLTPELQWLAGPRSSSYPEVRFRFRTTRTVLDSVRSHETEVRAQMTAVPLTRFPIAAYDLPSEIGAGEPPSSAPILPTIPGGLIPERDPAFVTALQADRGTLPYPYRRRAALAAAYQYTFSQGFMDHVAEYAGVTHFHHLGASDTASLAGMTRVGSTSTWDVGVATVGTHGPVSTTRDAAVLFADAASETLRIVDSGAGAGLPALLVVVAGPSDSSEGPLNVELSTVSRPIVIVGYRVRVVSSPGTAIAGALFLDPFSSIAPGVNLTVGHLSYWSGASPAPSTTITPGPLPAAAEQISPRVVYVSTRAHRQ